MNLLYNRNMNIYFDRTGKLIMLSKAGVVQLNLEGEITTAMDHRDTQSAWEHAKQLGSLEMMTALIRLGA